MKTLFTLLITLTLFSCFSKNYYTEGEEIKIKFEKDPILNKKSENRYEVIVKDFDSGRENVYHLPNNATWERKLKLPGIIEHHGQCVVFPERPGPKNFFIREMLCGGTKALVEFKNIVVCGKKINYDSETIRIIYNDKIKYSVQLRCFY